MEWTLFSKKKSNSTFLFNLVTLKRELEEEEEEETQKQNPH